MHNRLIGMPFATPNGDTKDIRFALEVLDAEPIMCVAEYGVAAQIAGGLGNALDMLRTALAMQGAAVSAVPTPIRAVNINRAILDDVIIVELTSTLGIPYTFQLPAQVAEAVADRLKLEASKDRPAGHA